MPTLVRTVNLEPTKLNLGTQYSNMLLNCKEAERISIIDRKTKKKVASAERSLRQYSKDFPRSIILSVSAKLFKDYIEILCLYQIIIF